MCTELDNRALDICREFSHGDETNACRKSNKEAEKDFLLQLRK